MVAEKVLGEIVEELCGGMCVSGANCVTPRSRDLCGVAAGSEERTMSEFEAVVLR